LTLEKLREDNPAWMVAPALVWASVLLHGDVQTGYSYGFAAVLWVWIRSHGGRRRAWLRFVGAGLLVVLLASIQLAPTCAVSLDSERRLPSFSESALRWSTHPLRRATVVAAPVVEVADYVELARSLFGGCPPGDPSVGCWAESLDLGVPVVGLALLGGWVHRDLRGLVWLGGFALLLSLGQYGSLDQLFSQVRPLWSAFRSPERLMGFVACAAAMLAGAGVEALRRGRGAPSLWFLAAGICAALGARLLRRPPASGLKPPGLPPRWPGRSLMPRRMPAC
jgi:hypothetical protein